jgi:hyaluronan synthase
VALLSFVYIRRVQLLEWHWAYLIIIVYGFVVTPFLISRLVGAYLYKPVPDRGFRPKISVIVPVFNEGKNIVKTIEAVLNSAYPKDKMELIVIDDKSTDNTLQIIQEEYEKFCKSFDSGFGSFKVVTLYKNMGKRHAMAAGVRQSSGDFLICVDSDAVVKSDAFVNLVQPFTDEKVYCVCGNAQVSNEYDPAVSSFIAQFQKVWYADGFRVKKAIESLLGIVICCSGVLSAYRRERFIEVMDVWLNETFMGHSVRAGDDRMMTNLMMKLGGDSVFQSSAVALTVVPCCFRKFLVQQLRWGRSSFRGMVFACRFFWRKSLKHKLVFYGSMFVTFLSPVVLFVSTVGFVVLGRFDSAVFYLLGLLLVSTILAFTNKLLVEYFTFKDVVFRMFFFVLTFVVAFVYLYAWLTPWKGTVWGTR